MNNNPVNGPIAIESGDLDVFESVEELFKRLSEVPEGTQIRRVYLKHGDSVAEAYVFYGHRAPLLADYVSGYLDHLFETIQEAVELNASQAAPA